VRGGSPWGRLSGTKTWILLGLSPNASERGGLRCVRKGPESISTTPLDTVIGRCTTSTMRLSQLSQPSKSEMVAPGIGLLFVSLTDRVPSGLMPNIGRF
jgi:hypothetical protein